MQILIRQLSDFVFTVLQKVINTYRWLDAKLL